MEPTSISTDMLNTAEGQSNAVFACVGSALQHAQRYEYAVKFFIRTLHRFENKPENPTETEALVQGLQKQTLGRLLRRFNDKVRISDDKVSEMLERAVEQRNFLAHHFFWERSEGLNDEAGRLALLRELAEMQKLFEQAATMMRALAIALEGIIEGTRRETPGDEVLFTMEIDDCS